VSRFRFIDKERAAHPITILCRVLEVSRAGYHAWKGRAVSARARADTALEQRIREIHSASRGTYGSPRVHAELQDVDQIRCGRKRVARLMRRAGLVGVSRRRYVQTTRRDENAPVSDDLVHRVFTATAPDQLWLADITYLPTWQGFLYLAIVLDAYSRRVVGWGMADHMRAELVVDALEMACWHRRPGSGLVHHSDHGSQYTSLAFGRCLREAGIAQSMGTVGDCYDNAMAESFFATLECELIKRTRWRSHSEARMAVFDYIETFYNPVRRHSALDYRSPAEHERRYRQTVAA
jgi:putative transposase